jgi:hypothetical protein
VAIEIDSSNGGQPHHQCAQKQEYEFH